MPDVDDGPLPVFPLHDRTTPSPRRVLALVPSPRRPRHLSHPIRRFICSLHRRQRCTPSVSSTSSSLIILNLTHRLVSLRRTLRGRFLHITDMHLDPHYLFGASHSSSCHRNKPKKDSTRAGHLGVPYGSVSFQPLLPSSPQHVCLCRDCDSPLALTNFTFDWLDKHWAKEIDFVICMLFFTTCLSLVDLFLQGQVTVQG